MNSPIFVAESVLDFSKMLIHKSYCDYMIPKWQNLKTQVCDNIWQLKAL